MGSEKIQYRIIEKSDNLFILKKKNIFGFWYSFDNSIFDEIIKIYFVFNILITILIIPLLIFTNMNMNILYIIANSLATSFIVLFNPKCFSSKKMAEDYIKDEFKKEQRTKNNSIIEYTLEDGNLTIEKK
jgi:hypothetical protein